MIALAVVAALAGATVGERFAAPPGYARVPVVDGTFAAYLRALPLLPDGTPLRTFDGRPASTPHLAIVDLDVGAKDLQQCADSALRLYAEWRWARGTALDLVFHATSGDPMPWRKYAAGERPRVAGNKLRWVATTRRPERTHAAFRAWLDDVFMYAGSASLRLDTDPVAIADVRAGDLFVLPGSPGHVLLVLDVVVDAAGKKLLLLGEGYMPAQGFHVVPTTDGGAWHDASAGLVVPTWAKPFPVDSLRRFRGPA